MEFRPIKGAPGYFVSDSGEVRSQHIPGPWGIDQSRWTKLSPGAGTRSPYPIVHLCCHGKQVTRRIHSLVLEAFVGPCPPGMEARHLDGRPTNNRVKNLQWSTHAENMRDQVRHGTRPHGSKRGNVKLVEADIPTIRRLLAAGHSQTSIGKRFGVSQATIWSISRGRIWKHVS